MPDLEAARVSDAVQYQRADGVRVSVIFNSRADPISRDALMCFLTAYFFDAARLGAVYLRRGQWTAPVLLSGYMATGSFAGSLLQLFNIAVGCLIYRPFIKLYDRRCEAAAKKQIGELVRLKTESEAALVPVRLTEVNNQLGLLARSLVSGLNYAISQNELKLYYQPQYDKNRKCFGAEALLRWYHPVFGMMYPPLVIQLAGEGSILTGLEQYILKLAVADMKEVREKTGFCGEISVNVSASTLQQSNIWFTARSLPKKVNKVGRGMP